MKHTSRFTVIGNHLAQHEELSLLAIGLAVHIQSLPAGTCISIRSLAERFPEGEIRIAAALRDLETYGYLARTLERLPGGRMATRTVSYNRPGVTEPNSEDPNPQAPEPEPDPDPEPDPQPEPDPGPPSNPKPAPAAASPRTPAPAPPVGLPEGPAATLLLGLRAQDHRLLLSVRDIQRLAPGVTAWLDRGAHSDAIRRTLTADLPADLTHPAGLLSYRLTALLPPPVPAEPVIPAPHPFQTCEDCDLAFRAPEPGRCRPCLSSPKERAA
ncbi:helix-turn-helix domain-containing protein [Streptomyces sp. NPDC057271]|uniref:helix-turn-helix domain-containing protein n=1 Tax=unclassified Streptomyces TaxID=2593676 RepID=UPI0036336E53